MTSMGFMGTEEFRAEFFVRAVGSGDNMKLTNSILVAVASAAATI